MNEKEQAKTISIVLTRLSFSKTLFFSFSYCCLVSNCFTWFSPFMAPLFSQMSEVLHHNKLARTSRYAWRFHVACFDVTWRKARRNWATRNWRLDKPRLSSSPLSGPAELSSTAFSNQNSRPPSTWKVKLSLELSKSLKIIRLFYYWKSITVFF